MRLRSLALLLGCVLAASVSGAEPNAADSKQTRATMGEIFQALAEVLPASLDDRRFSDPANRDAILAELTKLAASGAKLEAHGQQRDASFGFLSRSLARDTEEIRRRYADGRTDEARFLFHEVTHDCVACHSRLPSQHDASLGTRLMAEERVAALPLEERARLEFATRQFERAETTLEALLASPDHTANDLDLSGTLDEYLELCLRVRRNYERPTRTLERFAARSDVGPRLRAQIDRWLGSLRELSARKLTSAPLVEAQALVAAARDRERFPDERGALVYDLEASSQLLRFVESTPAGPEAALAYFRLGEIESRIGRSFWLSQTEAYLETAIRMAPGEPFAQNAFDLLQEFLISGYTGSGGQHVPADVEMRLAELRGLLQAARPVEEPAPSPARQVEPPATR